LSAPFPLRFLFASRPDVLGKILGIVYRVIASSPCRPLLEARGLMKKTVKTAKKKKRKKAKSKDRHF